MYKSCITYCSYNSSLFIIAMIILLTIVLFLSLFGHLNMKATMFLTDLYMVHIIFLYLGNTVLVPDVCAYNNHMTRFS